MDQDKLRQLQLEELKILEIVDQFCRENQIEYSLCAGTGIGAVRHQGFIPWDDDIDIFMVRSEYRRFLELWPKDREDGLIIENPLEVNVKINHTKIVNPKAQLTVRMKNGQTDTVNVWIDIFPVDKVASNEKEKNNIRQWNTLRILLTGRDQRDEKLHLEDIALKTLHTLMPKKMRKRLIAKCEMQIQKYNDLCENFQWVDHSATSTHAIYMPEETFDGYADCIFEQKCLRMVENKDAILRPYFGDYMAFPPVEEQVPLHEPLNIFVFD